MVFSFKNPSQNLLVTQLFSTVSYAVLYSTLVLFMTQALGFSATKASAVMGVFAAFNFGLHLLGGYMGGRLVSYRVLFLIGMVLQVIACIILTTPTTEHLYIALALFLTGSWLNVPCINMMLTQQFTAEDAGRETAFFWNYAGMNVGFFLGFTVAGIFQTGHAYSTLFMITTITNILAFIILLLGWKNVEDITTPLAEMVKKKGTKVLYTKNIMGFAVIVLVAIALMIALQYPLNTDYVALAIGIVLILIFIPIAQSQSELLQKKKVYAYIILSIFGLAFWVPYSLAPMALTMFTEYNVNRAVFHFTVPTQWFQNINTLVLAIGGPLLPLILIKIRKKFVFSFPMQFAFSIFFVALGFLMLPIGIITASKGGYSAMIWLILSYFFQLIGELLIGPTGYAMIGKLASARLQGLMMGAWMVVVGSTSGVIASLLSIMVAPATDNATPLQTNHSYLSLFSWLTVIAVIAGIILYFLVPMLRKLADIPQKT